MIKRNVLYVLGLVFFLVFAVLYYRRGFVKMAVFDVVLALGFVYLLIARPRPQ